MRRLAAVLALAAVTFAGCGKTMAVGGGLLTMTGAVLIAVDEDDGSGCAGDTSGSCIDLDFDTADTGATYLGVGLVLMTAGAVIAMYEGRAESPPAPGARVAPPIAPEPAALPPPPADRGKGVWRAVPPVR